MRRDLSPLPPHTSASQVGTYIRCGRMFAFKYLEKREPESRSSALARGSAVGPAVAWHFTARKAGDDPGREDVLRVLRADLGAALAAPEYKLGLDERTDLFVEAEKLVGLFLERLGGLDVIGVEERFEMHLFDPDTEEPLPRPFVGYFDLVLSDRSIVELKTAARAYGQDTFTNVRFAGYRYVAREEGRPDVLLKALIKTKTPKLQEVALGPATEMSATWFLRVVRDVERAIAMGSFPPNPGMACTTCDYRAACFGLVVEQEARDAEAA